MAPSLLERCAGSLVGLACGDAVGTTVELQPRGSFRPVTGIVGTGYAVASLEAVLFCFHRADSFEEAVLRAVNLGDDADTTAAIVGQIAGAHHGLHGIPASWRSRLHMGGEIEQLRHRLGAARGKDPVPESSC